MGGWVNPSGVSSRFPGTPILVTSSPPRILCYLLPWCVLAALRNGICVATPLGVSTSPPNLSKLMYRLEEIHSAPPKQLRNDSIPLVNPWLVFVVRHGCRPSALRNHLQGGDSQRFRLMQATRERLRARPARFISAPGTVKALCPLPPFSLTGPCSSFPLLLFPRGMNIVRKDMFPSEKPGLSTVLGVMRSTSDPKPALRRAAP